MLRSSHRWFTTAAIAAALAVATPDAATAQSLSTTFAAGNFHAGNMFDVTTLGGPLRVTALDINVLQLHETPATLNVAQATLGSRVSVKTLDGKKVAVRIPPGTGAGRRFRIRNQGIAKGEHRGDLIVETTVTAPEKLNDDAERLMKEFAEAAGLKH